MFKKTTLALVSTLIASTSAYTASTSTSTSTTTGSTTSSTATTTSKTTKSTTRIFEYSELAQQKEALTKQLHDYGFVAIRGVPGYTTAHQNFLKASRSFISCSDAEKKACSPKDGFVRGWSSGIEMFNGKVDAYKGSYYATIPETAADKSSPNVWPTSSGFKKAYMTLANIIYKTGQELMPMVGLNVKGHYAMGRMLYYGKVDKSKKDSNPNWCGKHRDHGIFTGLCSSTYVKDGKIVDKPAGSGLYVRGQEVSVPSDVLIFQVGETAQLMTNGAVTATDHHVKKAFDGHERYTFALFINGAPDMIINSSVTEYNDRFTQGMTYKQWHEATLNKYRSDNKKALKTVS